jgi:hypothetical protein
MNHQYLADRYITDYKGRLVCTEFIVVKCPSCRNDTIQVATMTDRTWYGHSAPNNTYTWCIVERGKEDIVDAIMYARTNNPDCPIKISTAVGVW